jgi:catechol 2,3-dioxygenase-like lactoylglutathione lyase family enzyme
LRLNQVTMPCVDYAASVAFYKALGLILIVDSPPHYARFECTKGDGGEPATLSLHEGAAAARGDFPAIYFEVDDVAAEVARLKGIGITVDTDTVDRSWMWTEAWLKDPAGNRICLYRAGKARRFPPWRVDAVAVS